MSRPGNLALAALAAAAALGGCGSQAQPPGPEPPSRPAAVEVMDPSIAESELPAGCSLREVTTIFDELLTGANTRDRARVLRRIAPQPELAAFVVGPGSRSPTGDSGRALRNPAAIYRYFARQSRLGHRRSLRNASVEPIDPGTGGPRSGPFRRPASGPATDDPVVAVGFGITVTHEDGGTTVLPGKGAINCETGRFYYYGGG